MGAPYQRQDVSNNIANGNVINADDLDAEFNALEAAFAVTTGHSHDGTTGEGGPITVVGPSQEVSVSSTQVLPRTTNVLDLGSPTFKFKDAYVDGVAYLDAINYNGTLLTPTAAELNFVDGVTSPIQTQLDALSAAVGAPSDPELAAIAALTSAADRLPYFTGSGTAALATFTAAGRALVDDADAASQRTTLGLGTMATQNSGAVTITGGTISGITDLSVADGGTGVSTITGIIRGNGTAAFSAAVAGTDFLAPSAIGTTVQAYDADLAAIAALTTAADRVPYFTGSGTAALATFTAFGRSLVDDTDAATARTTLGLGSLATLSTVGFSNLNATDVITAAEGISANNNDTTIPTSAAVKAYADTATGSVLLGTIVTTSGTTQSLSSLVLTPFKFLKFVFVGVSGSASVSYTIDGIRCSDATGSAAGAAFGFIELDLSNGVFSGAPGLQGSNVFSWTGQTSYRNVTTSITFGCSGGNFDAGSIAVYGVY